MDMIAGLPATEVGTGPAVVILTGLTPEHDTPGGMEVRLQLGALRRALAGRRAVVLSRRRGLPRSTTIHDLADHVAAAVREIGAPVPLVGSSTGGSIALQTAIDHPDVVERLVLLSAGCRLSERGRLGQRRLAELTEAGRPRDAWAALGEVAGSGRLGRTVVASLSRLAAPLMAPQDPGDMLATLWAEDGFDATGELHRVTAPTLVVGGTRDGFYTPEIFRETAAGVRDGRLTLVDAGHMGAMTARRSRRAVERFLQAPSAAEADPWPRRPDHR